MGWIPTRAYECNVCGHVQFFQRLPQMDWKCEACEALENGKLPPGVF